MPRYSRTLLDHAADPRNGGVLSDADAFGEVDLHGRAPRMRIYLRVLDDVVQATGFTTFGCGVSVACGSVLTEMIKGMSLTESGQVTEDELIAALDGVPDEKRFCAEMAVTCLKSAISKL